MTILVNYYPCSYGDSLVSMINGDSPLRVNRQVHTNASVFKKQDFYSANPLFPEKLTKSAYSCHRQNSFDYKKYYGNVTVISIYVDRLEFLPIRVKEIHIEQNKNQIDNPILRQLENRISLEQLILADYSSWAKSNILESDIILNFSTLIDPQECEKFCAKQNLKYNVDWVNNILEDLSQYV